MSKKRLEYMDMVKGIGILGIVIMHSTTVPVQVVFRISAFAPSLFFLSSGMLTGYTGEPEKNGKEMLRRKARALLLPFFSFSLLYILRDIVRVWMGISETEEVRMGVNDLVTLWGSSVLWFLPALFFSESIFVFLRKIFRQRKYGLVWTAAACIIMTTLSFFINDALKPLEGFFLSERLLYALLCVMRTFLRAVYGLPFICAGYVLFEMFRGFWEGEKKIPFGGQLAGGIVLFVLGILISAANGYFDFRSLTFGETPVLAYVAAMVSFCGILLVCKSCRVFKPLTYFGKNSLVVMATHIDFYFLYLALNLANRVNEFIPGWNRVFYFVNVVGGILALEAVCIMVINRFFPVLAGKRHQKRAV